MRRIATHQIAITDPYIKNAENKLVEYLLSFDEEKLLFEFYKVADLSPTTDEGYQGWERSDAINFRGHFVGHYLSAISLAYRGSKDESVKKTFHQKAQQMIQSFDKIQTAYADKHPESAGYLSAFRESSLEEVEGKEVAEADRENNLVPWYILHKILVGLLDAQEVFERDDPRLSSFAEKIAIKFGDFVYNRMIRLEDPELMLRIEYGGMNDALYRLYELSQDKNHATAASYFNEMTLFEQLAAGEDVLAGKHANTTIPKLIGALHHYRVFNQVDTDRQSDLYLKAAVNFWDIVVNDHTYSTGGNSQSEHFHHAGDLYHDAVHRVGDCTCETCNTYNMLKLSLSLYEVTGDVKYLNYYEKTYINAILASQNPETGMMMYFQPMDRGYNKVYNRPYDEFWCCTGTGIESFAKLSDAYYFVDAANIYLNLFFSNVLEVEDLNLRLEVKARTAFEKVNISVHAIDENKEIGLKKLAFRLPSWSKNVHLVLNETAYAFKKKAGFGYIENLKAGDRFTLSLNPVLTTNATADNPNYLTLEYGPFVLASRLGAEDMEADNPNGILVRVGTQKTDLVKPLIIKDAQWTEKLDEYLSPMEFESYDFGFKFQTDNETLEMVPYYQIHKERYGIYQLVQAELDEDIVMADNNNQAIASLTNFDHNNSEFARHLRFNHSETGELEGRNNRYALANGWFSYSFKGLSQVPENLLLTFHQDSLDQTIKVVINDQEVERKIQGESKDKFIQLAIDLKDLGQEAVQDYTLIFKAENTTSPALFGIEFY